MRKPWEEAGSHRDSFGERHRRSDRRSDRRFDDRRSEDRGFFGDREGFGGRGSFGDRRRDRRDGDDRRSFSDRRPQRGFDRKAGFGSTRRRDRFSDRVEVDFGVRSGPRARAAMNMRRPESAREPAATRNALITLDADVARVFGSSEAVNAALRHLIALAGLMGEAAIAEAQKSAQEVGQEPQDDVSGEDETIAQVESEEVQSPEAEVEEVEEEDEEWFELPPVEEK